MGVERSLARLRTRAGADESRSENMDMKFHHALRAGYLKLAKKNKGRIFVIDANDTEEMVWFQIKKVLDQKHMRMKRMTK